MEFPPQRERKVRARLEGGVLFPFYLFKMQFGVSVKLYYVEEEVKYTLKDPTRKKKQKNHMLS